MPNTKALDCKFVEFVFSENTTYQPRYSSIVFKQKDGDLTETLYVTQEQTDVIIPEQNEYSIEAIGGTLIINFETNDTVSYVFDCDWISVSDINNSEFGSLSLEVVPNAQNDRSAEITLYGGDAKATVLISQTGMKDGEYMSVDYGLLTESLNRVNVDTITTATIYGKINEEDFKILNKLPNLARLDLSHVTCSGYAIPTKAFMNNEVLEHIVFADDIFVIGESAFRNCTKLALPELPKALLSIENYAFYGNDGMKGQLNLPSNLQYIGNYAFSSCTGISGNLSFPDNIYWIGNYSFSGCSGLDGSLTFPVINDFYIGEYAFNACRNFTGDLVIPSNLNFSGGYEFAESGFTGSVYVDVAGWYTFKDCKIGENLIISDNLENLSQSFRGVDVGGYIYIGKGVTSLESQTFYVVNCEKYYIAAPVPPICKQDTSIELYGSYLGVPKGKKTAYENADYWKNAQVIEEVDFSDLKLKP